MTVITTDDEKTLRQISRYPPQRENGRLCPEAAAEREKVESGAYAYLAPSEMYPETDPEDESAHLEHFAERVKDRSELMSKVVYGYGKGLLKKEAGGIAINEERIRDVLLKSPYSVTKEKPGLRTTQKRGLKLPN